MDDAGIRDIAEWIVARGLAGDVEIAILNGFCDRCVAAGLAISRASAVIDTLHPVYEGRAFLWRQGEVLDSPVSAYGRSDEGYNAEAWRSSPFYHLLESGDNERRYRLTSGETSDFAVLKELRDEGETDYFAMVQRFNPEAAIGEMDCFMSRWTTTQPGGFTEADIHALRRLVPTVGLAIKSASLAQVAESLVETYLGRGAGRRVLKGNMSRGVVENITAALWFSDMQGYTAISENMASGDLISLLDDYAEAIISSIHGQGGDVLKLMGDGVLAIFSDENPGRACEAALRAEADLRARLPALNARRQSEGRAIVSIYLGLHIGDVHYGNIGSAERLDFTVVGQAVNEVSRIAGMCQSAGRELLISDAFNAALDESHKADLVSVGRYALRGLGRAQELFTRDPALV
jgi:adenylate cyclase